MTDPTSIAQAIIALGALFAGGWFLVNSKLFPNPVHTTLTGAACFATVGFIIARLGFAQAKTTIELVQFESAATGFAIIVFGLFPYCLTRESSQNSSPYRVIQALAAAILLAINYDRPISLRFSHLAVEESTVLVSFHISKFLYLYATLAIAAGIYGLKTAWQLYTEGRHTKMTLLGGVGVGVLVTTAYQTHAITSGSDLPRLDWIVIGVLFLTCILWRIAHRKQTHAPSHYWNSPPLRQSESSLAESTSTEAPVAAPYEEENAEEEPAPMFRQAILFKLPERESTFVSKLLSSKGFTVMHEDGDEPIPGSHFQEPDTAYALIFDRDQIDGIPYRVSEVIDYQNPNVSVFAISSDPNAPAVQREIRSGRYLKAIGTPIKAMELFNMLDGPNSTGLPRARGSLRDVRG